MMQNQTLTLETKVGQSQNAREIYLKIAANIAKVMQGQSEATRKLLATLASGGHALLEDFPGTGKTTLAKVLARSIDASFKRIQFTPDLLPSDILGVSIFNQRDQNFHFHEGPVFTNILLADEINRASPRTQSALLEAWMANIAICRNCSSSSPPRTRWNSVAPIPCPRRRWTGLRCNSGSVMCNLQRRSRFSVRNNINIR